MFLLLRPGRVSQSAAKHTTILKNDAVYWHAVNGWYAETTLHKVSPSYG